ncbi:hypothetical protein Dsin_020992 [Dipteronia sinensis]|uniref:RNase H type-1 domain-containing protein n=1 Tax=Dipteronia sinensis TaxID=43782 RepID=A0AAE0AAC8_9ROSI|nr:hypothetical protein Dsin_020992 [Dipteronia sinensis]
MGTRAVELLPCCAELHKGMSWWEVSYCANLKLNQYWESWNGMCPNPKSRRAWCSLFYAVVWTFWESRNIKFFEGNEASISSAADLVKFRVGWWFKHHGKGSLEPITTILLNLRELCIDKGNVKPQHKEAWCPSGINGIKFNVDGSSRDSNTTEILAIHKALELCVSRTELLGRDIVIASDSKVPVSWVNNSEAFGSLKHVDLIYDIKEFMKVLGGASVVFNPRHTNSCADNLAKMGSNLSGDRLEWGDL